MSNFDSKKILEKIGDFKIANPKNKPANLSPKDKFKELILKGLEKQIEYITADIEGNFTTATIKRWWRTTENKNGFYCFLKYQNKPIPFLENNSTAIIAKSLIDVKLIYSNLKKEIEENPDFLNYLFELTKKMKIAKGAIKK